MAVHLKTLTLIAAFSATALSHASHVLEPGAAFELDLAGHPLFLRVPVSDRGPLLIEAIQEDIHVILIARERPDTTGVTVDNPVQDHGVETLLLETPGEYELELQSTPGAKGRVRIGAVQLSAESAEGRKRIEAERAITLPRPRVIWTRSIPVVARLRTMRARSCPDPRYRGAVVFLRLFL